MKIADLIDQYEQSAKLRGVAPTQMNALIPVRRAMGNWSHKSVKPATVGQYVAERRRGNFTAAHRQTGAANGTIRRELGALSAVLNWAHQRGILPDAPPKLDLPPQSPPRENFLTKDEADRLWDFAAWAVAERDADDPLVRPALFAMLALDTWARANAIETLPWSRVSIDTGRIDYRDPTRPETTKRRVPVPISSRLSVVLASRRLWAAPTPDAPVVGNVTQYAWKRFTAAAGFPDLTRHDLRRTGISLAVARGVDLVKIAQMAGDDYGTVLKHYARFAPDYLKGVVE